MLTASEPFHPTTGLGAVLATLAALTLAPSAALAQNAAIGGTVVDATGLLLPGVTVEARNQASDGVTTAFTDVTGRFFIDMLVPGTYELTFTLPGFGTVVRGDVQVEDGAMVTIDVELEMLLQETVTVIRTRPHPQPITASAMPVDVITAADLASQADVDLALQLRTLDPSFSVNNQRVSDAATVTRSAGRRNMSPDHTVVLVNGKRRHRAAVIAWLGNGFAAGSQGSELSAIPSIALGQVELLRNGATALYDSDAIAGVLNLKLKDARSGGRIEFRAGQHYAENDGDPATCGEVGRSCNGIGGFAPSFTVAGNAGLPLGLEGFVNLSLEYGGTQPTNRALNDSGTRAVIAGGNTHVRTTSRVWGSPLVDDDLKLFANFGSGGNRAAEFYGHANYASKKVTGGFHFRNPNNRGGVYSIDGGETLLVGDVLAAQGMGSANCPTVAITNGTPDPVAFRQVRDDPNCFTFHESFLGAPDGLPGGFTPQFGGDVRDFSVVAGVRGTTQTGLEWDVSGSIGQNQVDTFIYDTVNASLGPESLTSFQPNLLEQTETSLNADFSYAASDMIDVAGGVTWREEQYHLGAGDDDSWEIGPYAAQGFSSGSNGYNGTRPENAGTWNRPNFAVYGNIDVHGVHKEWNLVTAVRIEDFYDSFGATVNSTIAGRYRFKGKPVALRASVSSGFRAPTPGQQNVFNVATEFDYTRNDQINSGTISSTSSIAALRGGMPLQPEESINYSFGTIVVDSETFIFTADYFRINMSDLLTLTQSYVLTPVEIATLRADEVAEAGNLAAFRFLMNDFSTRNQGIDFVAKWKPPKLGKRTTFSGRFNYTDTTVTEFSEEHFEADRITSLTRGQPKMRWNASVNYEADRWIAMARLHHYGPYWDREDARLAMDGAAMSDQYSPYSCKALLDAEVRIPIKDFALSVGARNLLNTYPDENLDPVGGVGNRYGQASPFGFNGGYYYIRINYGWGMASH